jgi:hypothetical protein
VLGVRQRLRDHPQFVQPRLHETQTLPHARPRRRSPLIPLLPHVSLQLPQAISIPHRRSSSSLAPCRSPVPTPSGERVGDQSTLEHITQLPKSVIPPALSKVEGTGGTAVLAVPDRRCGFPSHVFCAMNSSVASELRPPYPIPGL